MSHEVRWKAPASFFFAMNRYNGDSYIPALTDLDINFVIG